jgi:hypothetical protein
MKSLFRFSLKNLLIATGVVALACVALRSASENWAGALLGVMIALLAAAILLAIYRRGADRAFWIGFAVCGWLYVLTLIYGWDIDPQRRFNHPLAPYNLATSQATTALYKRLPAGVFARYENVPVFGFGGGMPITPGMPGAASFPAAATGYQRVKVQPSLDEFINTAHPFWTLLLSAFGGWFARWLYHTGPERRSPPAPANRP